MENWYEHLYLRRIFQENDIIDNNVLLSLNIVIDAYPISNPKNNTTDITTCSDDNILKIGEHRDLTDTLWIIQNY